jgi:hypothetical protein
MLRAHTGTFAHRRALRFTLELSHPLSVVPHMALCSCSRRDVGEREVSCRCRCSWSGVDRNENDYACKLV